MQSSPDRKPCFKPQINEHRKIKHLYYMLHIIRLLDQSVYSQKRVWDNRQLHANENETASVGKNIACLFPNFMTFRIDCLFLFVVLYFNLSVRYFKNFAVQ